MKNEIFLLLAAYDSQSTSNLANRIQMILVLHSPCNFFWFCQQLCLYKSPQITHTGY